jgi:glutathione S-transferase
MITLYHAPVTRSHLIRFALEELSLPHDIVRLDVTRGEHKAPAYLKVNPLGQLPALIDGDVTICESAAICLHLVERAPERALAPRPGAPERAAYHQWVVFAVASELVALGKIALHGRFLPEAARSPAVLEEGHRQWASVADVLSDALQGKQWLLGESFSAADVMVGGSLWLAELLGVLGPYPELVAYHGRVSDRPAFARAFDDAKGGFGGPVPPIEKAS